MLKAYNLAHSFDRELFSGINLELNPATSTAILGVSGSGKSTLLHILSTLLKPDLGEVIYKGRSIYDLNSSELNKIRRFDFGIIFQAHYLFKGFNAAENIEIANILSSQSLDLNLIKKLQIQSVLNQKIGELSGGQQQRVSIARVLSKKPSVIFADEPTGNLDKQTAECVIDILNDYIRQNNATLIMVTHDNELAKKCNYIYKLENGSLNSIVN